MPIVRQGKKTKNVKNCGWLVRHLAEVERVTVVAKYKASGGTMVVDLKGGVVFEADWADLSICREWILSRKGLRGVPLNFNGVKGTCG